MSLQEKYHQPTLCLNMIVKNESKIITRLFDSVINIIDCYCICDTGSTDNTCDLIKTYFESKNIPGTIVNEPFKNFAHNRNFALKSCVGMSDYVLLMDADMILQITYFVDKVEVFEGIKTDLPNGYTPKIKIQINFLTND
jgi:glycosyltransferase involved in cell wall biosynthesis